MKKIAIFDFDKTITTHDTFKIWVKILLRKFPYKLIYCFHIIFFMKLTKNPIKLQLLKNKLISKLIINLCFNDLEFVSNKFKMHAAKVLRYQMLKVIERNLNERHIVYIVTASPELAVSRALDEYNVHVVGLQFEIIDGRFTGKLIRKGCHGKNKRSEFLLRVNSKLNLDFEVAETWGDCLTDLDIMNLAKKRYWIFPSAEERVIRKIDPEGVIVDSYEKLNELV